MNGTDKMKGTKILKMINNYKLSDAIKLCSWNRTLTSHSGGVVLNAIRKLGMHIF